MLESLLVKGGTTTKELFLYHKKIKLESLLVKGGTTTS